MRASVSSTGHSKKGGWTALRCGRDVASVASVLETDEARWKCSRVVLLQKFVGGSKTARISHDSTS